tara:strand:+ start:95 stop:322 length:228 start_codon:yes stop_codon:yes gene_type:complete
MKIAFLLLNVVSGTEIEINEELKKIENVKEAYFVHGMYDFIIRLESKEIKEIKNSILKIRKLSGIESTLTMNTLE